MCIYIYIYTYCLYIYIYTYNYNHQVPLLLRRHGRHRRGRAHGEVSAGGRRQYQKADFMYIILTN